jgi:UDP-N-acetylmuramate dehydrogenase
MIFEKNVDLTALNTFGISARAAFFASFDSEHQLREILQYVPKMPITILGGGSNMLLTKDLAGTVLHNQILGKTVIEEDDDQVLIRVGAGENWHDLVLYAVDNDWSGIENLSLIPGCVGASPMQNIGAYGVEIKDVLHEVEALHIATLETHRFSNEACQFGYRESIFKRDLKGQYVITQVTFRLSKRPIIRADYGAIQDVLAAQNIVEPSIRDISNAVIEIRSSKLPDPKVIGNAGSFFKNPVIPMALFLKIQAHYPKAPSYPIDNHSVKVPAGWLIETAGWKGKDFGNCGVHDKQALVLVNRGGAKGQDIFDLSQQIIDDINQKFGIQLEREVNIY